mgnify:CR=1 FL=1
MKIEAYVGNNRFVLHLGKVENKRHELQTIGSFADTFMGRTCFHLLSQHWQKYTITHGAFLRLFRRRETATYKRIASWEE